ncbi:MAG: hypothetical protein AB1744_04045, partial [Candidatus Zixiibacteriota bacterium]
MLKINSHCLTALLTAAIVTLVSCSSQEQADHAISDTAAGISTDRPLTAQDSIEQMINEAITRLRLKDKSGLYELEFEYLHDDYTYDDYLNMGQIRWAEADTVMYVDIRNIEFFDHDSAAVDVTVNFEGPTGHKSYHR